MLVAIVVVITAVLKIGVEVPHLAFGISKFASLGRAFLRVFPCEKDKRTNSRAQRTSAAKHQLEYVEQALASSGNPVFLGHRSVPRIGLFTFDNSMIRGKEHGLDEGLDEGIVETFLGMGTSAPVAAND